jgi:hypothetical protein
MEYIFERSMYDIKQEERKARDNEQRKDG